MRFAPLGDRIVFVAIGHRPADDRKKDLRKRTRHLAGLATILDARKMFQGRPKS
jgi:hypothetical protein